MADKKLIKYGVGGILTVVGLKLVEIPVVTGFIQNVSSSLGGMFVVGAVAAYMVFKY